jgi:DNA-binding CsgD family transcriptional regulator
VAAVAGQILGRDAELARLSSFFATPRPRALLVQGQAGIGKTTIWREAERLAGEAGDRVLFSRAVEAEARLAFTVLGDLLGPVLDDMLPSLPRPQRRALEAALCRIDAEGGHPDQRAVSLGVLGGLRELASAGPVAIAVDDVQWLDVSSARVIAFALRRLSEDRVTVLASLRSAEGLRDRLELHRAFGDRLHVVALGPMAVEAIGLLLRDRTGGRFPHPLVERIHEASEGNPFFALEIGGELAARSEPVSPGEPLPVPRSLTGLLGERLGRLSAEAGHALLLAACMSAPTVSALEAAGATPSGIAEAERAGMVEVRGERLTFTHPLLRSSAYGLASSETRRSAHLKVAQAVSDPQEQAWHLALCATDPDAEIAARLEKAAVAARARGAPAAAAELLELAARATPKDAIDALLRRTRAAAGNHFDAGDPLRARAMAGELIATSPAGPARANSVYQLSVFSWNDVGLVGRLLEQAVAEVGGDVSLCSRILSESGWAAANGGDLRRASDRARSALALAEASGDAFDIRLALSVLATAEFLMAGRWREAIERAVSLEGARATGEISGPSVCLGRIHAWMGELDRAREILEHDLRRRREYGHETACWELVADLAHVESLAGNLERAVALAAEACEISEEAGLAEVVGETLVVRAEVEAIRGLVDEARTDASRGLEVSVRLGDVWNEIKNRSVLGFLELSVGRHAEAHAAMEPLPRMLERMGVVEPCAFPFVPDAVETLVALGELEEAKGLTERLEERGSALGRAPASAAAARCRGLIAAGLGDVPGALLHLERAVELHTGVPQPFELARTLLATGEVRRRMKKKRSAREALERALAIFDELGAPLWAGRAKAELARIGGRAPSPTELTPTERQVADLVVEGRTNKEIATALFLSVNTVEANLKRIYRKLDVRSRTELAGRFRS